MRREGGERQELPERREDAERHRGPEEHQEPWRLVRAAVSQEDVGQLVHREDGERQELPEHQEGEGPQERLDEAEHPHRRDEARQVRRGLEGHPRYQLSHRPSRGRREAEAG